MNIHLDELKSFTKLRLTIFCWPAPTIITVGPQRRVHQENGYGGDLGHHWIQRIWGICTHFGVSLKIKSWVHSWTRWMSGIQWQNLDWTKSLKQGVFQQQTMGIEWKTTKKRWVKKLVLLRHHGITGTLFSDKPLFFSRKIGGNMKQNRWKKSLSTNVD